MIPKPYLNEAKRKDFSKKRAESDENTLLRMFHQNQIAHKPAWDGMINPVGQYSPHKCGVVRIACRG
jgi:hypothetical protein